MMEIVWAEPQAHDATLDIGKKILRIHAALGREMGRPKYLRVGLAKDKGRQGLVVQKATTAEATGAIEVRYTREGTFTGQVAIGRALADWNLKLTPGPDGMIRLRAHTDDVEKKPAWVLWLP